MNIYLAGPDVFLQDAIKYGKTLKNTCEKYGHIGHFPLDNEIDGKGLNPYELAEIIKNSNINMIKNCDIVIANLSPFRGPEPDSGTVWEVGFAQALGKKVIAYSTDMRTLKEKTQEILKLGDSAFDKDGMQIEDFKLSHNLMYASCLVGESFKECLEYLNKGLK